MIGDILIWLGLRPSAEELLRMEIYRNSWTSLKISNRGGVRVDPKEVRESPEFQQALKMAKAIVECHRLKKDTV